MIMTPEERARKAEQKRRYYEANKEALTEQKRRHYQANKEAEAERDRLYREANKEALAERKRRYYQANKEAAAEQKRRWCKANKEAAVEQKRRRTRRNAFAKEDGSSLRAWSASLYNRNKVFAVIANLQPDPGQTLAELIHKLSGYAMEVCEQIANPPVTEDSPALTPPAAPDLF